MERFYLTVDLGTTKNHQKDLESVARDREVWAELLKLSL